jgi:large subunit ribosomal protein L7/L12
VGIFRGESGSGEDVRRLEARVARLEAAMARLQAGASGHPGVFLDKSAMASWEFQARQLAAEGKKIQAIKVVRQATNMGLKEAKDYVDGF